MDAVPCCRCQAASEVGCASARRQSAGRPASRKRQRARHLLAAVLVLTQCSQVWAVAGNSSASNSTGSSGNSTGNSTGSYDIPADGIAKIVAQYNLSTDVAAAARWIANPVDRSPAGDIVLTVRAFAWVHLLCRVQHYLCLRVFSLLPRCCKARCPVCCPQYVAERVFGPDALKKFFATASLCLSVRIIFELMLAAVLLVATCCVYRQCLR